MSGLMGTGKSYQYNAMQGMQRVADLQQAREMANKQMQAQHQQSQMAMTGSGMAAGAYMGAQIGSAYPVLGTAIGAVVGAGVGYLLGEVF